MERFLHTLRERKLDRIGAAYAVAAWAVIQGASIALPAFDAPAWVLRWLIVLAIAGLPVALALAWHINAGGTETARRSGLRRFLLPGALALVVAASMVQLALHWSRGAKAPEPARTTTLASIAVLPFVNLSGDPAKRYFSDGIADQLITELSRRPNLRVAARTSSFAFAGTNQNIKTIARTLNVGAVVEGSVREDGNRVRIVAELIDAGSGFQIWSQTYDRDLKNILALQAEISRAISSALSSKLTGAAEPDEPERARPSIDPQAYRDYLQGQFYFAQRSEEGIRRSIALFQRVNKRAPDYADGFAALGYAHATLALNLGRTKEAAPGEAAIRKALALDPRNPQALMALTTASLVDWKWRAAADALLKIESGDQGAPGLWHIKGLFLSYMGLTKLALPAVQKAVQLDPLSYIDRYNLALYLLATGRKNEAVAAAREGAALQPSNFEGQAMVCQVEAARGNFKEAHRIQLQLASSLHVEAKLPALACAYHLAGAEHDFKTVRAIADGAASGFPGNDVGAMDIAIAYGRAGDVDKAFVWLETAFQRHEPQICALQYTNPELKKVFADPRWKAYRDKPAFRDWEAARAEIAERFHMGE